MSPAPIPQRIGATRPDVCHQDACCVVLYLRNESGTAKAEFHLRSAEAIALGARLQILGREADELHARDSRTSP